MHELAPLIKDLAIILGIAGIVILLFQKIRQPIVLGYLLAGVIVGPYTPPHNLVSDIPNIKILSELGVIFLMFSLGLEFSFHKLKRVGFSAGITGLIETVFMLLVGLAAGRLLNWSFYDSLFLGAALAISSTTIIIKALDELKLKTRRFAEIVFGILVVEDLLAILLMVSLSTIVTTNNIFSSAILLATGKLILVIGGWFLVGYFLVPSLFRKIMTYASEETLTIISVALCLFLVCVANHFHYSTALGAFIMGSILAETPLVHRIEELIEPIRNIFAAVFFVSVGMLIDPAIIWEHLPTVFFICLATIIGKLLTTGVGAFLTGQSLNNALRIGFSMAQIGEFSFIIVGLGAALNATSSSLYPIIVAVSAITTFTTPYFIRASAHLANKLDHWLPENIKYWIESYASRIYHTTKDTAHPLFDKISATRFLINGIVIGIIFTLIEVGGLPILAKLLGTYWFSKVACWFLAMAFSSPFIWGMLTAFDDNQSLNKRVSLYIGWLLTIAEISLLSIAYFDTWLTSLLLLLISCAFFTTFYRRLERSYRWFEKQLLQNLNQKHLPGSHYESLAPWETRFVEIDVHRYSPLVGKTLNEHQLRQKFGINVIAICRGKNFILSPRGHEAIQEFDKLVLLCNDDQFEMFKEKYVKPITEFPPLNISETFALYTLKLEKNSVLVGQSIRSSNIREQTKGLVVGLERHGKRILNPEPTTILEAGDLLFIVGEKESLKNI